MSAAYRGTPGQKARLRERTVQLCNFFLSKGRLPSHGAACPKEIGLFFFLHNTLRELYRQGALSEEILRTLQGIPGALPIPPTGKPPDKKSTPRSAAFEGWLIRAEIYTARNGYRPTYTDDNDLYQWLNRARRKLTAGDLDEVTAARVRAVMEFPDIRTYRYWAAHGRPSPEEARRRYLTD